VLNAPAGAAVDVPDHDGAGSVGLGATHLFGTLVQPNQAASCFEKRRPDSTQVTPPNPAPDGASSPHSARKAVWLVGLPEGTSNALQGLVDDPVGVPLVAVARPAAPGRRAWNDL